MNRAREPRELQFTSGQLVIVFVLIIALGAFIFILGVSVGKKQARLSAGPVLPAKPSPATVGQKARPAVEPQVKPSPETKTQASQPSGKTAKSDIQREVASFQAQQKTPKAAAQEVKPAVSKAQPTAPGKTSAAAAKTPPKTATTAAETKAQPKTAVSPALPRVSPAAGLYYIQVAASPQKAEAVQLAESIRKFGFAVLVLDPFPTDRAPYYRVRVGGYQSEEDRSAAANRLAATLNKKPSDFYYPPLEKSK